METTSRERRRRKILERGSDRLAFIKGQVQNLPPRPLVPGDQDPPPNFSTQDTASSDAHDKGFSPVLLKHDPVFDADPSQTSAYNGGIVEGSVSQGGGASAESSKDPTFDGGEVNPMPVSLDDQGSFVSASGAVQHSETQSQRHSFFTPKQISSAIDASEKTRLFCSKIVAILVVLSHLGFPLLGNRFLGSIISFRPLYFILLTNVTLVIMRLLFDDLGSSQKAIGDEHKAASADDNNWAEQLSKTLEAVFVARKVIDAVFMDCSVYTIIVICGLSFTY
ncbi:hypothetical protein PTKIN_Ptkin03bG0194200 [Pterospermum kingtungense]